MAKRKHFQTAGRMMTGVVYTAAKVPKADGKRERKRAATNAARQMMNAKYSYQKLELQIAGNFEYRDWFLTLTYDDAHLPLTRADAIRKVRAFVKKLREHRRSADGQAFLYIYVTEGKHGDHRLHHHMTLNACDGDFELIQRLWNNGHVHFETIGKYGYESIAEYMTKEAREEVGWRVGDRMWSSCHFLAKPIHEREPVPDGYRPEIPEGAIILDSVTQQNEFGEFSYFKCILPAKKE